MSNTDPIIKMLAEGGASLVVEYGSSIHGRDGANDVDLFALYGDNADQLENIRLGEYEIIRLSKDQFQSYRHVLNPVNCTEPLLKGVVRYGPESTFEELRVDVESRDPNPEVVHHNLQRSYSEYGKARTFQRQGDVENAVYTLSFVASYRLFAHWYAAGNRPTTLTQIRNKVDTNLPVSDIFGLLDCLKASEPITEEQLSTVFREWDDVVLQL